ncbi:MAG: hypothetical protein R6V04_14060 [bacterium]
MKNKFNCVDMKHKSAEKINEKIQGYTVEEELKYWQKCSTKLKMKKDKISKKEKNTINS